MRTETPETTARITREIICEIFREKTGDYQMAVGVGGPEEWGRLLFKGKTD